MTTGRIEKAIRKKRDTKLGKAPPTRRKKSPRRVVDRLVGYRLSPFLWRKVRRGLSAGRVQSVAVRLVVEREREIEAFVPREYWTIEAQLEKAGALPAFRAKLAGYADRKDKIEIGDEATAERLLADLRAAMRRRSPGRRARSVPPVPRGGARPGSRSRPAP